MKVKTSELTGIALDWAVAKCEGKDAIVRAPHKYVFEPSTNWAQAGPIIEREGIGIYKLDGAWSAHCPVGKSLRACMDGQPTALVAAMRCYVASRLGDTVDVPDDLVWDELIYEKGEHE